MSAIFSHYAPLAGSIPTRARGSLVAWEDGATTIHGLESAEQRGTLFIGPGEQVYAGMVVGARRRPGDLGVNVCKKKKLDNMRSSIRQIDSRLTPHKIMSLDECIEYLNEDELLEVTPENLRLRKRILDKSTRERSAKRTRQLLAE